MAFRLPCTVPLLLVSAASAAAFAPSIHLQQPQCHRVTVSVPVSASRGAPGACVHMAVQPAPAVLAAFTSARPLMASTLDLLASCLKLSWRLGASAIVWMLLMKLVNSTRVPFLSGVACAVASAVSFGLARIAALITAVAGRIDGWRNRLLAKLASKAFATMQERSDSSSNGGAQPSPSAPFGSAAPVDPPIDTTSYSDGSVDVSIRRPGAAVSTPTSTPSQSAAVKTRAEYQKMRVKDLKAELDRLGVSHADAVEKSDLVDRLVQRIESGGAQAADSSSTPSPAASGPPPQQQPPPPSAPSNGTSGGGGSPGGGFPGGAMPNFGGEGMPTEQEAMKQLEALMANPDGVKLLQELEQNPAVMAAAMDIAQGGEAAAYKYENNAEVMAYLRRLEKIMGPM